MSHFPSPRGCTPTHAIATRAQRLRNWLACRPCVLGWTVYLLAAVLLVGAYGVR